MQNIVGDEIRNTEPATGRPLSPIHACTAEEVREVVRRARLAQPKWAALSWNERKQRLLAFRDLLNRRAEEVVDVICQETGKARFEALAHETIAMVDMAHYCGTRAARLLRDKSLHHHFFWPMKRSYLRYEPRGVVAVIGPWNFPFTIPMGDVLMSLAARNAVVVKPSEWTPRTMMFGKQLLEEVGIDPDLVGVVPGGAATGQALLDAAIDVVVFTGSTATGRKIAARCGERLIPCIAELGGKDAVLVLPDVDLDMAAQRVVHGAFLNAGQACASFERILVHESIAEPFTAKVVELTRALQVGSSPTTDYRTDIGAMVVPDQVDIVQRHIDDARAQGARILTGGSTVLAETGGRFFAPTVIADATPRMLCWTDETFGPTLPIMRYHDIAEAVRIANDSPYGLNAFVFSGSISHAEDIANQLQAGGVVINDFFFQHGAPEAPWGGWKRSGIGRVHGYRGLHDLCEMRYVSVPRVGWTLPVQFPYSPRKYAFFGNLVRRFFKGPWMRFV